MPAFQPEPLDPSPPELERLFAGGFVQAFRNFENLFVRLEDEAAVRAFEPDLAAITHLHPLGLAITARGQTADFVSRYFAPGYGIPEDPVTGSIHATLAPYWALQLGKSHLAALQCSHRGGKLSCDVTGDRVLITGAAQTFMKGHIED